MSEPRDLIDVAADLGDVGRAADLLRLQLRRAHDGERDFAATLAEALPTLHTLRGRLDRLVQEAEHCADQSRIRFCIPLEVGGMVIMCDCPSGYCKRRRP